MYIARVRRVNSFELLRISCDRDYPKQASASESRTARET